MAVANVRGRTPTKRIDMYKDHEFVVGRIVLGGDESAEAPTVIMGAGTWTTPIECTEDDHHFINLITRGMATGGSSKALAIDHYLGVSGGSPTIFRGCMELEDGIYAASASAADFNLRFGTAPSRCTGEGHAIGGQLRLPNRALTPGGKYSAQKLEIYLSGASTVVTPINPDLNMAILRLQVIGGDTADRRLIHNALMIQGETGNKSSKYMVAGDDVTGSGSGGTSDGGIQINVNGTQLWLATYSI